MGWTRPGWDKAAARLLRNSRAANRVQNPVHTCNLPLHKCCSEVGAGWCAVNRRLEWLLFQMLTRARLNCGGDSGTNIATSGGQAQ